MTGVQTCALPISNMMYEFLGTPSPTKGWRYTKERMEELDREGRIIKSGKTLKYKRYLDESKGVIRGDIWTDISQVRGYTAAKEALIYPTQKPEGLIHFFLNFIEFNKG